MRAVPLYALTVAIVLATNCVADQARALGAPINWTAPGWYAVNDVPGSGIIFFFGPFQSKDACAPQAANGTAEGLQYSACEYFAKDPDPDGTELNKVMNEE